MDTNSVYIDPRVKIGAGTTLLPGTILRGETVIGEGSVIAGSTFVTFSVPPHSRVSVKEQEIRVRQPGERD